MFMHNIAMADIAKDSQLYSLAQSLDQQEQQFSQIFHQQADLSSELPKMFFTDISELHSAVSQLTEDHRPLLAVHLLTKNIPLIKDYSDDLSIIDFLRLLFNHNEMVTAQILLDTINQTAPRDIKDNANFLYAKFLFKREQWQQVIPLLSRPFHDLSIVEYNQAHLFKGIALQKTEKYRLAIAQFELISQETTDYTPAQLNLALANIRQGWWTDAHIILERQIKSALSKDQEKVLNRLYITLGYSYLRQQYYRNARDSFGAIGLASDYANQSLIGLSLAAASQEDYVGALNAVRLLQGKKQPDLSVDEAHLLMPYFYEKSSQYTTASIGYDQSIVYFLGRISQFQTEQKKIIDMPLSGIQYPSQGVINLTANETAKLDDYIADATVETLQRLPLYQRYFNSTSPQKLALSRQVLNATSKEFVRATHLHVLQQKIKYLNSYIDQARYGLVRLYDHQGNK